MKIDEYKTNFDWKSVGHIGRYNRSPREGYLLIGKRSRKCKYMLKVSHFRNEDKDQFKYDKQIYKNEVSNIKNLENIVVTH